MHVYEVFTAIPSSRKRTFGWTMRNGASPSDFVRLWVVSFCLPLLRLRLLCFRGRYSAFHHITPPLRRSSSISIQLPEPVRQQKPACLFYQMQIEGERASKSSSRCVLLRLGFPPSPPLPRQCFHSTARASSSANRIRWLIGRYIEK